MYVKSRNMLKLRKTELKSEKGKVCECRVRVRVRVRCPWLGLGLGLGLGVRRNFLFL